MALEIGRIEAWTREMLEAEARKRGIRGPEFRPRRDLIRLILRHQYGDRLRRIVAGRFNDDRIAISHFERHEARQALCVRLPVASNEADGRLELSRARGDDGRGPRVKAGRVRDDDRLRGDRVGAGGY